jgi:hypothetical protein
MLKERDAEIYELVYRIHGITGIEKTIIENSLKKESENSSINPHKPVFDFAEKL